MENAIVDMPNHEVMILHDGKSHEKEGTSTEL